MKWHQFSLMAVLACIFFGGRPASAQQAGATPAPPAGMHAPDPCEVRLMISGVPCDIATQSNVDGLPLQAKWSEGDFAGIERQMMAWCDDKQRYPDGRSKMMAFTNAFRLQFTSWQEWDKERDKLARWHAAAPDSLAESLVEAMYWRDYAWKARGGGYASTVPKEAWELFGERMAMASASLQRSAAQAHACPLWYDLTLQTMLESGQDLLKIEAVYDQAIAIFPASLDIRFAMANVYTERWGGSAQDYERFALRATAQTSQFEGRGMYARLYWLQDCNCSTALEFTAYSRPQWRALKAGFEDLLKHYPGDLGTENKYASLACRANDRETYLKLRKQLGKAIYGDQWPSSYSVDVCDRRFSTPA